MPFYLQQDILLISDPKAVQYFYHTSGYTFPKPADRKEINRLFTGPGILCADGLYHNPFLKIA